MRIVFMGTPDFSVPCLQALIDAGYEVCGVVTQPDRPKGRGGKVQMSPVKELALKNDIPVLQPLRIRRDGVEPLRELKPDLCVTAAFGQILSQEVLDIPPMGTVNVHASLLPRHRGSAPAQWAILQGDAVTGVTTMYTDKGIDTGDMLLKREIAIEAEDTAETLLDKLSAAGSALLIETLKAIEAGTCPRTPQDHENSTYDPMLTKEMGEINFAESTRQCIDRVRAMTSWPGAYVRCANANLKVWHVSAAKGNAAPGTILSADRKEGFLIATADGALRLDSIQPPNGKRMDTAAYLLGHTLPTGIQISEVTL